MPLGIDPKIDIVFKKVFGSESNKPILIDLVQAVIREEIAEIDILNPYSLQDAIDDKLSILDIKASLKDGRIVHIEMQMVLPRGYVPRALFYWVRTFAKQLKEGEGYHLLKPVISIHFFNDVLYPEYAEYHRRFTIRSEDAENVLFTNLFSLHTIELPKFDLSVAELTTPLEQWCYFLRHGEELEPRALPETLRKPPIERAVEVIETMSHDEREHELYESRLKASLDAIWLREASLEEGKELGFTKGKAIGFAEGEREGFAQGQEYGHSRGVEEGISEGKQIGRLLSLFDAVESELNLRFGPSAVALLPRIRTIRDENRLRELYRTILLANTLQEVEERLG